MDDDGTEIVENFFGWKLLLYSCHRFCKETRINNRDFTASLEFRKKLTP
jgi:hypothetical protein